MKIGLFVPCYVDALYPEVGVSTLRLLRSLGLDVDYPERQTCCGQPMGNAGFEKMAVPLAKKFDELDRMLTQVTTEYCRDILEDAKGDREIVYSKDVLDREIRQYVGEKRFIPYEERHKWR